MSLSTQAANDPEIVEAMSRLFIAQDELKRISRQTDILPEVLEVTRLVAESLGWLQVARRVQ